MTIIKSLLGDQSAEILHQVSLSKTKKKRKSVHFKVPLLEEDPDTKTQKTTPSNSSSSQPCAESSPLSPTTTTVKAPDTPRVVVPASSIAKDHCISSSSISAISDGLLKMTDEHYTYQEGAGMDVGPSTPPPYNPHQHHPHRHRHHDHDPTDSERKRRVSLEFESSSSTSLSYDRPPAPEDECSRPAKVARTGRGDDNDALRKYVRQRESIENRTLLLRLTARVNTQHIVKELQTSMHEYGLVFFEWPLDFWCRESASLLRLEFRNADMATRAMNLNGMPLRCCANAASSTEAAGHMHNAGECVEGSSNVTTAPVLVLERPPDYQGEQEDPNMWWTFLKNRAEWDEHDKKWISNEKDERQLFLRNIPPGVKDPKALRRHLNGRLQQLGVTMVDTPSGPIHGVKFLRGESKKVAILSFCHREEAEQTLALGGIDYMGTFLPLGRSGSLEDSSSSSNFNSASALAASSSTGGGDDSADSSNYYNYNSYYQNQEGGSSSSLSYYGPAAELQANAQEQARQSYQQMDRIDDSDENKRLETSSDGLDHQGMTNQDLKELLNGVVDTRTVGHHPTEERCDATTAGRVTATSPARSSSLDVDKNLKELQEKLDAMEQENLSLREQLASSQRHSQQQENKLEGNEQYTEEILCTLQSVEAQVTSKSKQIEGLNKDKQLLEQVSKVDKELIQKQNLKIVQLKNQKKSLKERLKKAAETISNGKGTAMDSADQIKNEDSSSQQNSYREDLEKAHDINRKLLNDLVAYQKELAVTQRQLQLCQKQWSKAFQLSTTSAYKNEGAAVKKEYTTTTYSTDI